ncbi:RrF2 family transcriptional regulator [Sulfuriflexus mobilis]|uniref:RrF2 family transcriptional regulator n=1 Tax=Sulfuriflexus mobilis TaxID=1811807 RepID=UPI000F824A3F|nr:Rrf2 family transcriptional regulator [Sulfuriflexus mobilis]
MQLTLHTDYALRVLMYLAAHPGQQVTVAELAGFYDVSRHHLVKVVQGLVEHGFVRTTRGKHGGMKLAHNAERVSIGKVIRLLENHFDIVACFSAGADACPLDSACRLKGLLSRATEEFLQKLDSVSLADITKPKLRQQIVELQ